MGINKQQEYAQNLMSKRRETLVAGFIILPIMVNVWHKNACIKASSHLRSTHTHLSVVFKGS